MSVTLINLPDDVLREYLRHEITKGSRYFDGLTIGTYVKGRIGNHASCEMVKKSYCHSQRFIRNSGMPSRSVVFGTRREDKRDGIL